MNNQESGLRILDLPGSKYKPLTSEDHNPQNLVTLLILSFSSNSFISAWLWCFCHCWPGISNSIQPVEIEWWGAWLSVWREVQIICIWSSWCHCHPIISCFTIIQIDLTFLVPAFLGCHEKKAVEQASVCRARFSELLQVWYTICIERLTGSQLNLLQEQLNQV